MGRWLLIIDQLNIDYGDNFLEKKTAGYEHPGGLNLAKNSPGVTKSKAIFVVLGKRSTNYPLYLSN